MGLAAVLLAPASISSTAAEAPGVPNPGAPFLGDFISIWEDAYDNDNQALVYNPDRDEYLVAWVNHKDGRADVSARRISASGVPLPGSPITVYSYEGVFFTQLDVAYSSLHRQYLVVMKRELSTADHDIWCAHFDDDGSNVSPITPIDWDLRIQSSPSVVYNRTDDLYLVVYDNEKTDGTIDVVGRQINATTFEMVGDYRTVLASVGPNQYRHSPAVAFDPIHNQYLVSYVFEQVDPARAYVASKSVSANLTPGTEVDLSATFGMDPQVRFAKGEYMVTWANTPANFIGARRVNHDGQPFGAPGGFRLSAVLPGDHYAWYPHLDFIPNFGFLVVWSRFDDATMDESDILASLILPGADQPAGGEFLLDGSPNCQGFPTVACSQSRSCLLTESSNLLDYPLGDREIRGRLLVPQRAYLPVVQK